jgi:hypothetical protein
MIDLLLRLAGLDLLGQRRALPDLPALLVLELLV